MRTSSQNRSLSPKISIKQMKLSPNHDTYYPLDFNHYNPNVNLDQFYKNQNNNRHRYPQQKVKNNYGYRYPQSHIQSERSVNCQEILPLREHQRFPQIRQRRRKIFEKKTLKARVIPDRYEYDIVNPILQQIRHNSKNKQIKYGKNQQSQYYSVHQHQLNSQLQFVTLKNIKASREELRKGQNPRNNEYLPRECHQINQKEPQSSPRALRSLGNVPSRVQSRQSFNHRAYQNLSRNQGSNRSAQHKTNRTMEQFIKSNEILPSFANNSYNIQVQQQKHRKNKNIQLQTMIILSGIPEQVNKLKRQLREQRKQLSQLDEKIQQNNNSHLKKQKQLLYSLIDQHQQLTNKQYEINENLQKMSRIQSESGQRYEKILKYQLQIQRAQRIQNLCRQNQRLAQELVRNHSRDTTDLTPLSHPLNTNSTKIHSQSYQYKRPISSSNNALNNFTYPYHLSSNQNTNRNFRQEYQKNWRQISALQAPYKWQQSYDNDNTLRQLLSPLEVKHQFDL